MISSILMPASWKYSFSMAIAHGSEAVTRPYWLTASWLACDGDATPAASAIAAAVKNDLPSIGGLLVRAADSKAYACRSRRPCVLDRRRRRSSSRASLAAAGTLTSERLGARRRPTRHEDAVGGRPTKGVGGVPCRPRAGRAPPPSCRLSVGRHI